jgi:HEAT repeat protein
MRRIVRPYPSALAWCLVAAVCGCAASDWSVARLFQRDSTVTQASVETPAQRIERLRKLAKSAPKETPEEQARMSELLGQGMRNELDPVIRAQTVRTLGAYRTAEADAALEAALQDSDSEVRAAACETLGRRRGPEPARLLSTVVASDTDIDVRLAATRALGEVGDPAAVQGLSVALDDPNPAMQYRAMKSLEKVTGRDHGRDVAAWKRDVQDGEIDPPPSLADRFRQWF